MKSDKGIFHLDLFRGKNSHGEWVHGGITSHLHTVGGKTQIVSIETDENKGETYVFIPVREETIGQFTGVVFERDKGASMIFTGDLIKCPMDKSRIIDRFTIGNPNLPDFLIGIVKYDPISASYRILFPENDMDVISTGFGWASDKVMELVGNIHDNPELASLFNDK